jgi:hypothetical protein
MFVCPKKILMALLFMLLAAPVAFQAVRAVLGGWIATAEGLPKVGGLAVHALVFMVLSTLIWRYVPIGRASMFEDDEGFEEDEGFIRIGKSRDGGMKNYFKKMGKANKSSYEEDDN